PERRRAAVQRSEPFGFECLGIEPLLAAPMHEEELRRARGSGPRRDHRHETRHGDPARRLQELASIDHGVAPRGIASTGTAFANRRYIASRLARATSLDPSAARFRRSACPPGPGSSKGSLEGDRAPPRYLPPGGYP